MKKAIIKNAKVEPVKKVVKALKPKKVTEEFLMIFSRHPSHKVIRKNIPTAVSASLRLGSQTRTVNGKRYQVELNPPEAVANSSDKLLMKTCFEQAEVKTAPWAASIEGYQNRVVEGKESLVWLEENGTVALQLYFPIVTKHRHGSRGSGNQLHQTYAEFSEWVNRKRGNLQSYILEEFKNYSLEYRLHVTAEGCFYTCRKALKQDVEEGKRWFRNDSNSVWLLEDNPEFKKPSNWDEIVEHSTRALTSVGLDIGAIDVRVQSAATPKGKVREYQDFIILETNSAPSFGDVTAQKYEEILPQLINSKINV